MSTATSRGNAAGAVRFLHVRQVARHAFAPALVLLAPFLGFLKFHGYAYHRPEVLLCLAGIAAVSLALGAIAFVGDRARVLVLAGVLTFFADVQIPREFWFHGIGKAVVLGVGFVSLAGLLWLLRLHADRIVTAAAATVLVSTLLVAPPPKLAVGATSVAVGRSDLPLILHVILDEHIGIDGLPPDRSVPGLKAYLQAFYHSLGFRTFDAAYSEYAQTERSLGHLLNFSPGEYRPDTVRRGSPGFKFDLTRNAYFSRMRLQGYSLRVYQSDALQLCHGVDWATCETYSATRIAVLQDLRLRISGKARLIAGSFLALSTLHGKAINWYDVIRSRLLNVHVRLPQWVWYYRTVPLNGLAEMRHVTEALSEATRGELYFAHLMLPHAPLVYDDNCSLLPFERWQGTKDSLNGQLARTEAYVRYDGQVKCASRMVRELVEAIPPGLRADAIIIVQGDHGSRLTLSNAGSPTAEILGGDDSRDAHSTLFAVRASGLASGSDPRFVPITCILRSLVDGGFRDLPGLDSCAPEPAVFVTNPQGRIVKKPLAPFVQRP